MTTRTTAEQITDLITAERWKAQDHQRELDRRIVAWAKKNGVDPERAMNGIAFVTDQATIAELKKGLDV